MRLNQIVAIEKSTKSKAASKKSELYKVVQRPVLFNGFNKEYTPKDEEGERFSPEAQRVQHKCEETLNQFTDEVVKLLDVEFSKDVANCSAVADITINGIVIVPGAPVTFLLSLEKELTDLHTFVSNLPILDQAENWELDQNSNLYKADPSTTYKTNKNQVPIVLYQATDKHPAQTQLITKDEIVGSWKQIKTSGAIPEPTKRDYISRIEQLQTAVKLAREEANLREAQMLNAGSSLVDWIFKK
jgi:hypothetical protein